MRLIDELEDCFIRLTTETYPHGTESELYPLMEEYGVTEIDEFGNMYKVVGEQPTTMFTSHLDTVGRKTKVNQYYFNGSRYIGTDGSSILGADCKAGVALMLMMIKAGVEGCYYFFIGEEVGGKGSSKVAGKLEKDKYKRCISFDRKGYNSIITHQSMGRCCSEAFSNNLSNQFAFNGIFLQSDDGGTYTDSAEFTDVIENCTNLSVGYFNQHTGEEYQDMVFLKKLLDACVWVNWESVVGEWTEAEKVEKEGMYGRYDYYGFRYSKTKKGNAKSYGHDLWDDNAEELKEISDSSGFDLMDLVEEIEIDTGIDYYMEVSVECMEKVEKLYNAFVAEEYQHSYVKAIAWDKLVDTCISTVFEDLRNEYSK